MPDSLPPDLLRLRALETWHAMWLGRIREAIAAAEAVEERAARGAARRALPAAGWKVEAQRMMADGAPWRVHHGDCAMGKGRACSRDEARRLLAEGVDPCPYCRPDAGLGVL